MPLGRPALVALLTVLALVGLPAASASAASVSRIGSSIFYLADAGETNVVSVGFAAGLHTIRDTGAPIDTDANGNGMPDDPCAPAPPDSVSCASQVGDNDVTLILLDGNDQATTSSPIGITPCGGAGADTLTGGPASDFIAGEDGSDILDGGANDDFIQAERRCVEPGLGPPATDRSTGGEGTDALFGGAGPDVMDGGNGPDLLFGEAGNDQLTGGSGDDSLVGRAGTDSLNAGAGQDFLNGGSGDDLLLGGADDDVLGILVNQGARAPAERISREEGRDVFDGGAGDDTLNAGPGANVLNFGPENQISTSASLTPNGPDDLRGGAGRDTVTYVNFVASVNATLDGAANDGAVGEGDNVRPDNEVVRGGSADDVLAGTPLADTLDGGPGSDGVNGLSGNDVVAGGGDDEGADRLNGGDGDDSMAGGPGADVIAGATGLDAADGGPGADSVDGGAGNDRLSGGSGGDAIEGSAGDDRVRGAADGLQVADGNDSLSGGDGRDDLDGDMGDDSLRGGPGVDVVAGGAGRDIAVYGDSAEPVTATLDGRANDGVAGQPDSLRGDLEGLRGGAEQDTFTGSAGPDTLEGGAGEDYLDGGAGRDDLRGGSGADTVRSRDRSADSTGCGTSRDFAIVDADDRVEGDCEVVAENTRARPSLGRAAVVGPARGVLGLKLRGTRRFVPLRDRLRIPVRSTVDATAGSVRVTTAASRRSTAAATLSGAAFSIRQARRRGAATELGLGSGRPRACRPPNRVLARLRGSLRGSFAVRARRSRSTTRRATLTVEERCAGTLTRVGRGRVSVRDLGRRRAIALRAGRSYLAKAR